MNRLYSLVTKLFKKTLRPGQETGKQTDDWDISEVTPGNLFLGFGTGRCGMRWTNKVLISHDNSNGACERFPHDEAFYRYCCHFGIKMDFSGLFEALRYSIYNDWRTGENSFLFSPCFSLSVNDMVNRFSPEGVFFIIREPTECISSMFDKGWFMDDLTREDPSLPCGTQPLLYTYFHRNFTRITPFGDDWERWSKLTPIGKITWYYVMINQAVLSSFHELPSNIRQWVLKLSDINQNYDYYCSLARSLALDPVMDRQSFLDLRGSMSNTNRDRKKTYKSWSTQEKTDFEKEMGSFLDIYDSLVTSEPNGVFNKDAVS